MLLPALSPPPEPTSTGLKVILPPDTSALMRSLAATLEPLDRAMVSSLSFSLMTRARASSWVSMVPSAFFWASILSLSVKTMLTILLP